MDLYNVREEFKKGKTIFDLPLRVTYYARVSTDTDEQVHSLKNQVEYYTDFIEKNRNWTFVEGYIDEGLSGTSVAKRECFLKMIEDAKLNKFDYIITKEISRFSRNTLDSIKYTQELLRSGVGVLFQSDNINTLEPDSELRLTIMSSIAQDEVRKISERVKFGFKRAIDNGSVLGNSRIWGYDKEDGKLSVNEEEAEMIRLIFDLYANHNVGIRTISDELYRRGIKNSKGNPLSFSTLRNIIANPKYKGYYCGRKSHKTDFRSNQRKIFEEAEWVMYKDQSGEIVPAIVSEELWEKANHILQKRSEKMASEDKTSYQNKYAFSGKIICMKHNLPYYRALYKYNSGNKEVWCCKEYQKKGKAGCDSPLIYTTELNKIMKDCYDQIVQNKAEIIHDLVKMYSSLSQKSTIQDDIAKCRVMINDILQRKDKLLDLSIKGRLPDVEFEERNDAFNKEIENAKAKIVDLEAQQRVNKDIEQSVETLRKVIAKELDFEDGLSNNVIESLLEKIEIYKTDKNNVIDVKVYFKVIDENLNYTVNRGRKSTSVCSLHSVMTGQRPLV